MKLDVILSSIGMMICLGAIIYAILQGHQLFGSILIVIWALSAWVLYRSVK